MARIIKIIENITKIAGAMEAINLAANNEHTKKAAEATKEAGKKVIKKVKRVDEVGNRKFKYSKQKLSYLYGKEKISEELYDYLIGELKHIQILTQDPGNFEKRFKNIIAAKNRDARQKAVKKYEKIRDKYL